MRFLIQRVTHASVAVDGETRGEIDGGLLVLIGIRHGDTMEIAQKMIAKTIGLRIFEDDAGKMNRSILDLSDHGGGPPAILAVSQFTLYADCRKGRRPSFSEAAAPEAASALMDAILEAFSRSGVRTQTGQFGAHMVVSLVNDGPVTILLDSDELFTATG